MKGNLGLEKQSVGGGGDLATFSSSKPYVSMPHLFGAIFFVFSFFAIF